MLWAPNCQVLIQCSIVLLNYKVVFHFRFIFWNVGWNCNIFAQICFVMTHSTDGGEWWRGEGDGENWGQRRGDRATSLQRVSPNRYSLWHYQKFISLLLCVISVLKAFSLSLWLWESLGSHWWWYAVWVTETVAGEGIIKTFLVGIEIA